MKYRLSEKEKETIETELNKHGRFSLELKIENGELVILRVDKKRIV